MMICDPEIAAVACYRYSLIEVEQEDLHHAELLTGELWIPHAGPKVKKKS